MSCKHPDGYERRLPNRRRDFETHRCDAMPDGFSLRRYAPDGRSHQYPEPGGWVLAMHDCDHEWMTDFLNHLTPFRSQFVRFCPWCGERLG